MMLWVLWINKNDIQQSDKAKSSLEIVAQTVPWFEFVRANQQSGKASIAKKKKCD